MSGTRATQSNPAKPGTEGVLEAFLFATRWLLAPVYIGLSLSIIALLLVFARDLYDLVLGLFTGHPKSEKIILTVLTLIDISLAANLVIIVTLAGYENFVSKLDNDDHPDRPDWLGKVDFGGLKLKLIASITAISAIQLLKMFMSDAEIPGERILWMVVIHITFVVSGVMLSLMDFITAKTKAAGYAGD